MIKILTIFSLFLFASFAQAEPIQTNFERFTPVVASNGMVVSEEPLATKVGVEILRRGGNAVDAAVAVGFALAVTLPQAGNLGGGGFMMVHHSQKTSAIDYREVSPQALIATDFLKEDGSLDEGKSRYSHVASGVPGSVAGLLYALENYGTLSRKEVMQPAMKLAKDGFEMSHKLHRSLTQAAPKLLRGGSAKNVFFDKQGEVLAAGAILKQPDLYRTLQLISDKGTSAFYTGEIAKKLVADSNANGGRLTVEDLANYTVENRKPIWGEYRGYKIAAMPPPSSGGVHVVQMLNMLKSDDLKKLGHNSAEYIHLLAETMKRAYADRSKHLGDPDYYNVPQQWLTSSVYAKELRENIGNNATPSSAIHAGVAPIPESPQTTHFSVIDANGNGVSNTYTLNFSYGNGHMPKGLGFLLNNEMDDFAILAGIPNAYGLVGGKANAIESGKRPLSSMTPVLMFSDGELVMAAGSPGGSRIITAVLQTILNVVDFGFNIATAVSLPRVHHQWLPDELKVEQGISPDTITILQAKEHIIKPTKPLGSVQAIIRDNAKNLTAISDPRRMGLAAGN